LNTDPLQLSIHHLNHVFTRKPAFVADLQDPADIVKLKAEASSTANETEPIYRGIAIETIA